MANARKRVLMALLAIVILVGGTGITFQPAQAAVACSQYHLVQPGQTLSWIGRAYGIPWKNIAALNGLTYPYTIYSWTYICIRGTGGTGGLVAPGTQWSYEVTGVDPDVSVTIQMYRMPSNVVFYTQIGRYKKSTGQWVWEASDQIDSNSGGTFYKRISIPAQFVGRQNLRIRVTQDKKNISIDRTFTNGVAGSGWTGTGTGWCYGCIPTFTIVAVERNNWVRVRTNYYPPNLTFKVKMNYMGTRGVAGQVVGDFLSGDGSPQVAQYTIPAFLAGQYQIAIRMENAATGYYSYNWFYNNSTQ